jgi:type IV secretory pathway VirB2 component (pilin)
MNSFSGIAVAQAAGPIEDATPLTVVLMNILQFLLSVAGIVGIIGIVIAGVWYLTASGDEQRMRVAKSALLACVIGTVVVLSALIVVRQIGRWFA